MILQEFNNGWGAAFELRQFEQQVLDQYLRPWQTDRSRSIVVNSTWYNLDYHDQVLQYIRNHGVDQVALVSFMDPAIVRPSWFDGLDIAVHAVGYYTGDHELDIWSLIVQRYFDFPATIGGAADLDSAFLCLNRKPHWHRKRLVARLEHLDLVTKGCVTLGDQSGRAIYSVDRDVEPSQIAPNPGAEQYGIINDIMSLGPMQIWNSCFLNIVTETVFDVDQEWFVSEKIYKPVIGLRPFLVYAPNGANAWLQHLGMETYCDDFRDITDLDLRDPDNIPAFLLQLVAHGTDYWRDKYQRLLPKMHHNKARFYDHVAAVQRQIQQGIYSMSS